MRFRDGCCSLLVAFMTKPHAKIIQIIGIRKLFSSFFAFFKIFVGFFVFFMEKCRFVGYFCVFLSSSWSEFLASLD